MIVVVRRKSPIRLQVEHSMGRRLAGERCPEYAGSDLVASIVDFVLGRAFSAGSFKRILQSGVVGSN